MEDKTCVTGSEIVTGNCTVLLEKLVSIGVVLTDVVLVVVGVVAIGVFFVVTGMDLDVVAEVGKLLVTTVGTTEL